MSGLMLFANNAATTLASGITNTATSLSVASGTGSLFPNPTGGQYFYMTLANTSGTVEIVKCTARSTDTFTVTRGQDGTSAVSWNSGDKVEQRVVAADLNNMGQLDSTNTWAAAQTFSTQPVMTNPLSVGNGGSGTTTAQGAMNAFAGAVTSGSYLRGNGTNVVMSTIQAADVPTLNQNTTGSSASCTGNAATASNALGVGQSWQNMSGSRAGNTTYTNSTGRTIFVWVNTDGSSRFITLSGIQSQTFASFNAVSFAVPNGGTYLVSGVNGGVFWLELR